MRTSRHFFLSQTYLPPFSTFFFIKTHCSLLDKDALTLKKQMSLFNKIPLCKIVLMLTLKHEWKTLRRVWGKGGKAGLKCGRRRLRGIHQLVRACTPKWVVRKPCSRQRSKQGVQKKNLFVSQFKRHKLRQASLAYGPCPKDFILIKATHFLFMQGNAIMVDQQIGYLINQAKTNFAWQQESDGRWNFCRKRDKENEKALCSLFELSPGKKLWKRWYEYNACTLSTSAISKLKMYADNAWGLQPHSPKNPNHWPLQIHPMVWTLLTFFWKKGLRPVASQVPVACFFTKEESTACGGQTNLGTFIDLLMYEPPATTSKNTGTLWALELKKMQSGPTPQNLVKRSRKTERHKGVLDFISIDGEYGTASAQALFGETLLRHNYQLPSSGLKIKSAVLRVCSTGIGFQEVPRSWTQKLVLRLKSLQQL